jgi:hypothetical protein
MLHPACSAIHMSNITLGIAPNSDIQFTQLGAEVSKMHRFLLLASLLIATTRLADAAAGARRSWAELSGKNSWDGLLDTLDVDLRRAIIRYGELAQATSDSFIGDPASPYAGASRYAPPAFLRKAQVPTDPDAHRVTRFLYATSTGARVSYLTRPARGAPSPTGWGTWPWPRTAARRRWGGGTSLWRGAGRSARGSGPTTWTSHSCRRRASSAVRCPRGRRRQCTGGSSPCTCPRIPPHGSTNKAPGSR